MIFFWIFCGFFFSIKKELLNHLVIYLIHDLILKCKDVCPTLKYSDIDVSLIWLDRFVILPTFDLWSCDHGENWKVKRQNLPNFIRLQQCLFCCALLNSSNFKTRTQKFCFQNSFHYSILKFAYIFFTGVIWQWFARVWSSLGSHWMNMFVT